MRIVMRLALSPLFWGIGIAGLLASSAPASEGVTAKEITIGSTMGLTGPVSDCAKGASAGIVAAFKRANREGGIQGRQIKFVVNDDSYDPKTALDNVQKLADGPGVLAVLSSTSTAPSMAVLPFVTEQKIPFLFPYTGGDGVRVPFNKNVFNLRVSYNQEAHSAIEYAIAKLKVKKVAAFYQDDSFGQAGRLGVTRALGENGLSMTAEASYPRLTKNEAKDIDPALETLMKAQPELVYICANLKTGLVFIERARAKGFKPIFVLNSIVPTGKILEKFGKDIDNVYVTEVFPLSTDTSYKIVREFKGDMKKAGSSNLDSFSLEGYVNARVLIQALKSIHGEINRQSLIESLESLGRLNLGGVEVNFSATNHSGLDKVFLIRIQGGVAEQVAKEVKNWAD